MKDTKLNNLLGIEQFSEKDVIKPVKQTKRTEVAKDVLQENAYVVGKDVLKDKLPNKEDHTTSKGLNNLISLDDFTKNVPSTKDHVTKRTSTAKDVLLEKAKKEKEECCDDDDKMKSKSKKHKCDEDDDECDDKKGKKGLTAAQKKLPEALQKSILKKQGK